MAFVRSKKIKGRPYYYYLVENYRESGRVRQRVVKYLGRVGFSFKDGVYYLTAREINELHERLLRDSGGERGIVNSGFIDYVSDYLLDRVYSKGKEKDDLLWKAAKLMHMLITQHPFVDANKRTGFESAKFFLMLNHCYLIYDLDDAIAFCLEVSSGQKTEEEVFKWLSVRLYKINPNARSA